MTILQTERLRLEPFADHHFEGLHVIDSDPEVMRYITGKPDTREDTAAGMARVTAAFDTLRTPQLCAVCHPDNKGSARVMQRLGMSYRGSERWYEMDTSVYEISRSDWQIRTGS